MTHVNKTAVVFGGTGLVGQLLIKELIENQSYDKIIAVLRNTLDFKNPKLEQLLFNDFRHLTHLKDELKATDYFCCIGTTIKTAGSQKAFHLVDYGIPVQIAQMAQELAVQSLVVVSSIGARDTSSNFYLKTKGKMEKSVREFFTGNLKIVRPSLLMGNRRERRLGERIATVVMFLIGWIFIGPLQKYRGIFASDVAKAMIRLTEFPATKVVYESDELRAVLQSGLTT